MTIGIIGSGNVAWHLAKQFNKLNFDIQWVYSRNEDSGNALANEIQSNFYATFPHQKVDFMFICVNDDQIQKVVDLIPEDCSFVYTSGSIALSSLSCKHQNIGVFYPLQTFSKTKEVDFSETPIFIEASNPNFEEKLNQLASKMSKIVQVLNSEKRTQIHIAAVFANNFVNHLFYIAEQHLQKHDLDFKILKPLVVESIEKAFEIGPKNAQSGPAIRGDFNTIERHLSQLSSSEKEVYQLITKQILQLHHA